MAAGAIYNDIHDNHNCPIIVPNDNMKTEDLAKMMANTSNTPNTPSTDLFHYTHPSLSEDEQRQVDATIRNLVKQFAVPEICTFLKNMRKENKLFLPPNTKGVMKELQRLGMPDETAKGFSYENFKKYYEK